MLPFSAVAWSPGSAAAKCWDGMRFFQGFFSQQIRKNTRRNAKLVYFDVTLGSSPPKKGLYFDHCVEAGCEADRFRRLRSQPDGMECV